MISFGTSSAHYKGLVKTYGSFYVPSMLLQGLVEACLPNNNLAYFCVEMLGSFAESFVFFVFCGTW